MDGPTFFYEPEPQKALGPFLAAKKVNSTDRRILLMDLNSTLSLLIGSCTTRYLNQTDCNQGQQIMTPFVPLPFSKINCFYTDGLSWTVLSDLSQWYKLTLPICSASGLKTAHFPNRVYSTDQLPMQPILFLVFILIL